MGRVLMFKCRALIWMMLFRRISFSPYWTPQEQQGRKTVWAVYLPCSKGRGEQGTEQLVAVRKLNR